MKRLYITIIVVTLIIVNWSTIHGLLVTTPDFAAEHDEDVILYATAWCGYCAKTRQYLKQKNIPYFEYNIETSSEGYRQYKLLNGNGVPLVLVKNNVIRGYNPAGIEKAFLQ